MSEMYFLESETGGTCYLVKSEEAVVVFDPGNGCNVKQLFERIEAIIGDRPIDAIFLTHSHYDHVGTLPYLRQRWQKAKVYGAEYAKKVLGKPSAREVMRELIMEAAKESGSEWDENYSVDLLCVDEAICDGEVVTVGDISVKTIETVGHTKCSLSFVIDNRWMLAAETIGLWSDEKGYLPQFLIDYEKALASIRKCRKESVEQLALCHDGFMGYPDENVWQRFEDGLIACKENILNILKTYDTMEDRMEAMSKSYWVSRMPKSAFTLNAQAMLKTIEREFLQ